MRVGWGFDAHRLNNSGPLRICGVVVAQDQGVEATSDGDVALHAVGDALLGAGALGDLGEHFPSSDERWHDCDSGEIVTEVVKLLSAIDLRVRQIDVTVLAQSVRIAPYRHEMRERLAALLAIPLDRVSVKATTTDRLGFIGSEEGIGAVAAVTISSIGSATD